MIIPYQRSSAVAYAHLWAYGRNPAFYDFEEIGGDCTNFASQCLYAGTHVMNFTPDFGWYYLTPEQRTPSWTGVPFFWDFMTRPERSPGPFGVAVTQNLLLPGDFVQLRFQSSGDVFAHTPVVVEVGNPPTLNNILVAAHSVDADYRPLDTYENVEEIRFLHILGAVLPEKSSENDVPSDGESDDSQME